MSNIYQDALDAQRACNLVGLVNGFARALKTISDEARTAGHGTDWINQHPVAILFAEQVYFLTGSSLGYRKAFDECTRKSQETSAAEVPSKTVPGVALPPLVCVALKLISTGRERHEACGWTWQNAPTEARLSIDEWLAANSHSLIKHPAGRESRFMLLVDMEQASA